MKTIEFWRNYIRYYLLYTHFDYLYCKKINELSKQCDNNFSFKAIINNKYIDRFDINQLITYSNSRKYYDGLMFGYKINFETMGIAEHIIDNINNYTLRCAEEIYSVECKKDDMLSTYYPSSFIYMVDVLNEYNDEKFTDYFFKAFSTVKKEYLDEIKFAGLFKAICT